MLKNTILLDFDGVLRHWTTSEISIAERDCGLEPGKLLSIAFSKENLEPTLTGLISHEDWVNQVNRVLAGRYGKSKAECLIGSWMNTSWEIDHSLLENIKLIAPECKIVLVTNATSKLVSDLETSGLIYEFDLVVNSSDIGYAKPDSRFFQKALSLSNCDTNQAVFIDDSAINVSAAESLGIKSLFHKNSTETLSFVQSTVLKELSYVL